MLNRTMAILLVGVAGLFSCPNQALAQSLSLDDCWHRAEAHYPLTRQYGLLDQIEAYNLSNAGKRYLPQVSLSAKASYQSDVTSISVDASALGLPISFPKVKKDQYGATLDLSQLVYDGGVTKAIKKSIQAETAVSRQQSDVSLYALRRRVHDVYFGLLLLQEQERSHALYQAQLKRTEEKLQASLRGGVVSKADVDAVHVDYLKGEQTATELKTQIQAYTEVLAMLMGETPKDSWLLERPRELAGGLAEERPELKLIAAQQEVLGTKAEELKTSLRPTLGLFAQGGYARPGLNMLKADFAPYYIVGAKLSWSLGNFYTYKGKRKALEAQGQMLSAEADAFRLNQSIETRGLEQRRLSSGEQLRYDDEIVRLKRGIYQVSEAKLLGGTLSATDAMRDLTSLRLAEQERIQHDLSRLKSTYDLRWTQGQ